MEENEIKKRLEKLEGWQVHKGRLEKTYIFPNFARAAVFFNKIINPIESMDHHPVIVIAYNRVSLSLFTNDQNALTEKDFDLAEEIEKLV